MVFGVLVVATLALTAQAGCVVDHTQCYVDTSSRILDPTNVNSGGGPITLEYCAQLCSNAKKALAGTENGGECYCGDHVKAGAKPASAHDCHTPCTGSAKEECGGYWRISVYNVSCSGPPVPPPHTPGRLGNPCLNASSPFAKMPFCDSTKPIDVRVADAVSRMTLAEKISTLGTGGHPIASLGLPAYNWWSEATHGISHVSFSPPTPTASDFAFPITTAMSFNRTLWLKTGGQIGREARAFMNAGNAWSTYWAPVINLAREPRWGRNLETPGEDPYLTGEYATAFVKGMQESPDDPSHIQASACCKHYVANSMESSSVAGVSWTRHDFDASVTQQDLVDSYMLPFQACVEKGQVTGLMCSYNAVNGVPSCANDWLLNEVARGDWGFDGYVTSDCDADGDVFNSHHYTKTPEETVRAVLHAGTDVDCGGFVSKNAQSALDKHVITEADIDKRLSYLFRMRMRLSHFDPEGPLDRIPPSAVCSDYAIAIARDGAAQGSTMVKNDGNTLPLNPKAKSATVIGPNSDLCHAMTTYYGGGHPCHGKFWTMVDAVQQYVNATTTAKGVPSVTSKDTSGIPAAVALAKAAEEVVLAVGTDLSVAREGHDATDISLSSGQLQLISAVAAAASKPVVVVVLSAVPLDLSPLLSNAKVGAIVVTGQPSSTVMGVGDVLFGKKVPAGRTIQTMYPASYVDGISIFDFNMRPGPSVWPRPDCPKSQWGHCKNGTNPGRTYRFYTGKAVVPFGYGLSYTTFTYHVVGLTDNEHKVVSLRSIQDAVNVPTNPFIKTSKSLVEYAVNVTNTGHLDADDVVLGFLTPPNAGKGGVPLKKLFGFERVHVKAGESVMVYLYPEVRDFTTVLEDGKLVAHPGMYGVEFGIPETAVHGMGYARHRVSVH